VVFDAVAFAAVLAVFSGIALLLFFEDFVAAAFLATFTVALPRPLVALRLAGAAFFVVLEALFLRVFCDTACARNCHAPVRCFYGNPPGPRIRMARIGLNVPNIAHFPQKSMIYAGFRAFTGPLPS
jgi:hypothetical protein